MDDEILPQAEIKSAASHRRQARRDRRFAHLRFETIRQLVGSPTDRLALVLAAYFDREKSDRVALTTAKTRDAGLTDRSQKARALQMLERRGLIRVLPRPGLTPIIERRW